MNSIDSIKKDITEYIGVYKAPQSNLEEILCSIVDRYSKNIYLDSDDLMKVLKAEGVEEHYVYKVCLMTKVAGFEEILRDDDRTMQTDLDRFVSNAVAITGFNRLTVMELTRDIIKSFSTIADIDSVQNITKASSGQAYVIPSRLYYGDLSMIASEIHQAWNKKKAFEEIDTKRLEPLVAAGIPKAKYYMGLICTKSTVEGNSEKGMELLKEASDAGDAEATAFLGDVYFGSINNWDKAYECYTGYGAAALTPQRKLNLTGIINHKMYNKKILSYSAFLIVLMILSVLFAPGASIFATHKVWGIISCVFELLVFVIAVLHYRYNPYDSVSYVPVSSFIIWFFYMAIRLLF